MANIIPIVPSIGDLPTIPASSTPLVLTRNVIPSLTEGLDASDVLEVYSLVRQAPLHGIANSTIRVHKMAVGLRFRPTGATVGNKEPLELTLEYGPQRLGPSLLHEAMPFIQIDEASAFVSWENVGKVYYTTQISSELYLSANYMASMTGAVLNRILQEAVNYAGKRRRYQPFAVYSLDNQKELRSSSSADFTEYMWHHLAELGVEVEPILIPPMYEARLWATEISKEVPEPVVSHRAATFYQKLYQCIEAIATGDYSAYIPTAAPSVTSSPSAAPTPKINETLSPSAAPSLANTTAATGWPTLESDNTFIDEQNPLQGGNGTAADDANTTGTPPPTLTPMKVKNNTIAGDGNGGDNDDQSTSEPDNDCGSKFRNRMRRLDEELEEDSDTRIPTPAPSELASSVPTIYRPPSTGHDVENAKKAAEEAQVKANEAYEAAQTEGDTKAADAAQAAASAAQKAADATSNAASQAAMVSLLSGDGHTMSSILSTCFSDPLYDIASIDDNGTLVSHAYLYRDGSLYYKLNMTSPYFEIVKVERTLPKAQTFSVYGSGGDFIDWTLALVVLGMVVLGALVLLQQVGYHFIEPLYKCQRWYFNPRRTGRQPEFDNGSVGRGQKPIFTYGEDGIPLSMGGRLTTRSPIRQQELNDDIGAMDDERNARLALPDLARRSATSSPAAMHRSGSSNGDSYGEIELKDVSNSTRQKRLDRSDSGSSEYSHESYTREIPNTDAGAFRKRFTRDPDLVDLPHLKSKSKVAVPVGVNGYSSDDDFLAS